MTARELAGLLGRTGTLQADGFRVNVRILDARQAYGVDRVLVENQADTGQDQGGMPDPPRWVNLDRVTMDETNE